MKKYIRSSETKPALSAEDKLKDLMGAMEDNFDYATDGIDKLASDTDINEAISIATELNACIDSFIKRIAESVSESISEESENYENN